MVIIANSNRDNNHERRRIIDHDISQVNDKECADGFRAELRDFQVVGAEVENSSHCHSIQKYLHEALVECLPMPKVKNKST